MSFIPLEKKNHEEERRQNEDKTHQDHPITSLFNMLLLMLDLLILLIIQHDLYVIVSVYIYIKENVNVN